MTLSVTVMALAVTAGAPAVGAPQISVTLDYQVASGVPACTDANGFRASVQRQLGYDPFRTQADRRVAVRITRTETGYDGRIEWTDAKGRNVGDRRLSTRRAGCAEIVSNVAFAVAVQIQLLAAVAEPPAPQPAVAAPPAPAPPTSAPAVPAAPAVSSEPVPPAPKAAAPLEPAPENAPTSTPPPPDDRPAPVAATSRAAVNPESSSPAPRAALPPERLRLSLGVGPSLALGLAPRPTAIGRLFVDGRVSWFSLELSFDGALPVERRDLNDAGFSLQRYAAEAAACGHTGALAACLTGALGYLKASGLGLDAPRAPSGFSAQAGARLVATRGLGARGFAAVRAEGDVQLSRWTVTINDGAVWSTPRFAGVIGVDVGVRIF